MTPALYWLYTCLYGWIIYRHMAWDHRSVIGMWAVQSLKTMISDGSHASFLLNARRREPWWERLYIDMRVQLLLLSLCAFSSFSIAQVNHYDMPADPAYGNTYISPNYNTLFQLGVMAKQRKQREMKIRELIQKSINLYNSYPHYPQKIEDGWHQAICLCPEDNLLLEIDTYVNDNNEITTIDFGSQTASDIKLKIIDGKAEAEGFDVYFFDDIWRYNKNYDKTEKVSTGGFVKIKSEYYNMIDLLVLRSQPDLNSSIVYKLQESDLPELILIIEKREGAHFIKVKVREYIGYISQAFVENI